MVRRAAAMRSNSFIRGANDDELGAGCNARDDIVSLVPTRQCGRAYRDVSDGKTGRGARAKMPTARC